MAQINYGRTTAEIEGSFVVFLIGFRINKPWKVHKWLPIFLAMPRMLRELSQDPESGFLGYTMPPIPTMMVQYWRSFEHLEDYARSKDHAHWPAWLDFNKRIKASSGDVGIWHETYRVAPGEWEAVYGGVPTIGLAKASASVPLTARRHTARQRMTASPAHADAGVRDEPRTQDQERVLLD